MSFDKNYSPSLPNPSEQAEQAASEQYNQQAAVGTMRPSSHLVRSLEQAREYHLRKLIDIQNAIDMVNRTTY